jgi:hypothetical protein
VVIHQPTVFNYFYFVFLKSCCRMWQLQVTLYRAQWMLSVCSMHLISGHIQVKIQSAWKWQVHWRWSFVYRTDVWSTYLQCIFFGCLRRLLSWWCTYLYVCTSRILWPSVPGLLEGWALRWTLALASWPEPLPRWHECEKHSQSNMCCFLHWSMKQP